PSSSTRFASAVVLASAAPLSAPSATGARSRTESGTDVTQSNLAPPARLSVQRLFEPLDRPAVGQRQAQARYPDRSAPTGRPSRSSPRTTPHRSSSETSSLIAALS